ncbi:hypothetical protein ABPG75_011642 [Micractinium tetrahymenae]
MRHAGEPPWRCSAAAARPALVLLLALGTAARAGVAAAKSSSDAAPPPPPAILRPTCLNQGYGPWVEQPASEPGLEPAELDYSTVTLQHQGATLAQLAASGLAQGTGPSLWPVILEELRSQCACCRLCSAQNDYSQPAAAVIRCKRWSLRSADGACRLYAPDRAGARNASWPGSASTPEQQAWFSGSAERPQVLNPSYKPPPGAAPLQQCLVISGGGGGGGFPGSGDSGGTLRSPPPRAPPPRRPMPSPPARRPPSSKPASLRPPPPRPLHRPPPLRRSPPPLRFPPPKRRSPPPPQRLTPPNHRKRPPPCRMK